MHSNIFFDIGIVRMRESVRSNCTTERVSKLAQNRGVPNNKIHKNRLSQANRNVHTHTHMHTPNTARKVHSPQSARLNSHRKINETILLRNKQTNSLRLMPRLSAFMNVCMCSLPFVWNNRCDVENGVFILNSRINFIWTGFNHSKFTVMIYLFVCVCVCPNLNVCCRKIAIRILMDTRKTARSALRADSCSHHDSYLFVVISTSLIRLDLLVQNNKITNFNIQVAVFSRESSDVFWSWSSSNNSFTTNVLTNEFEWSKYSENILIAHNKTNFFYILYWMFYVGFILS